MVLNIIFSLVFWGAVLISFIKMLGNSGISLGESKLSKWIYGSDINRIGEDATFKECKNVAIYAFCFRVFIYIIAILAIMIFSQDGTKISVDSYLNQWKQWDASNYLRMAEGGYTHYSENGKYLMVVFFPLYSYLVKIMYLICRDYTIAGFLVSSISYAIGCSYLYALVALDYGKNVAKKSVIYISVFPFAFFYGAIMTESIFFLTTVAALYYIRKRNWLLVFVWGALSALSRMIGVFLVIPAVIEWCEEYKPFESIKNKNWKKLWKDIYSKGIFIALITVGTLIYLYLNYRVTGDAFKFLIYQKEHWHHESCYFMNTVIDIIKNAISSEMEPMIRASIWIPEALIFIGTLIAIVYAARRHRSMYVIYLSAYFVVNCSVTWLISGGRYMSAAVPLFVILAEFTDRHKWLEKPITIGFSLLMGIYLTGYLFSRQIM